MGNQHPRNPHPQPPQQTTRNIQATRILQRISQSQTPLHLEAGGAGSGKSHAAAQWILAEAFNHPGLQILVTRKTGPWLNISCWRLIQSLISDYSLTVEVNKTEHLITIPNGSTIIFKSLDDPEKVKSTEFDRIWVEEPTEITKDDFDLLYLRLRRNRAPPDRMVLTCNPIGMFTWVYRELVEKPRTDITICKSNHHDNPFLPRDYIARLEALKDQNENLYKVFCLGEWGDVQGRVYTNYTPVDSRPEHPDDLVYGLDFGFNNPSALVEVSVKDQAFYWRELLYESKLTNTDLIARLESLIPDRETPVYCDSAEPARIEELHQAGFNAQPARKHADSVAKKGVLDGIDFVKRHKLNITRDSVNLFKELSSYVYRKDKDGRPLDEPVKFNDHLLDAGRYGMFSHWHEQGGTPDFHID